MIKKFSNWLRKTYIQKKYNAWIFISDAMLWVDEYLNHKLFEKLVENNYDLWYNISYKYCLWTCDNFERFE